MGVGWADFLLRTKALFLCSAMRERARIGKTKSLPRSQSLHETSQIKLLFLFTIT